ncbi:hypothetical protein GLOIN_2v1784284 [Rhizophagus irregularis DAOM 181602=DAOM 197198]|nr:hypothetical protein GLOIN_2v1784284 [Rhizophagus irregularis DAOM 181602=DAOM 197198]
MILLNVIILHIQDEAKIKEIYNYLENSKIYMALPLLNYQRPLLNYISFCKHLNLGSIMNITKNINVKSIRELELFIVSSKNNYEIIKLIKAQKKLVNVYFRRYTYWEPQDEPPILSFWANLKSLELHGDYLFEESKWKCLENLSLPSLQFLKLQEFPVKYLISLVESTKRSLIIIELYNIIYLKNENERIIHTIYQNCPKLIYLTFTPQDDNILEIEKLLTTYNWKGRNPIFLKLQGEITIEMEYLLEEYEVKGRIVNYDECGNNVLDDFLVSIRSYQLEITVIDCNIEL